MGLLDNVMGMLPDTLNLDEISDKLGLTTDELKTGGEALFTRIKEGEDITSAVTAVSAETGIDAGKLQGLLPEFANQMGEDGEEGLLGKIGGFLDRDGDGNPLNDVADMAKGLFNRK